MYGSTFTVVLVRALRVAVEGAGFSVRGPARVSQAKVCGQLLLKVQGVVFWSGKHSPFTKKTSTYSDLFQKYL